MNDVTKCPRCGAEQPVGSTGGVCPRCAAGLLQATQTDIPGESTGGFTPPTVEELAAKFPQLEILGLLGRGGMGAVYQARQKELDRLVALKILPPDIGRDAAFAERFTREARALAKLNHPGIVTIYDFGRADGLYFFLMEFVDGMNLRELLHRQRISAREALAIVPQICDALQYAHDQGIVHRDIKPENLLIDRRGRVKVADFGLAKLIGAEPDPAAPANPTAESAALTEAGKIMGTPHYMSPEQVEHPGEVDHRADIYALGVVFYQMLTGELPEQQLQPPSRKVQIDVRLDEVVLRALEKQPDRRYQQASTMKLQVETIAQGPAAPGPSLATRLNQGVDYKNWFGLPLWLAWRSKRGTSRENRVPNQPLPPGTVEAWLALMDQGNYAENWAAASTYFQRAMKREEWVRRGESIRGPLGRVLSRLLISNRYKYMGTRVEVKYNTAFEGLAAAVETVTFLREPSGEWKGIGYLIKPSENSIPDPGGFSSGTTSPFISLQLREAYAHMTASEKQGTRAFSAFYGIWNSATFFLPMACLMFFPLPVPLNWIIATIVLLTGLAFYPMWWRHQARVVCSSAWARAQGLRPEALRAFPWGSTGLMLAGVAWLAFVGFIWWLGYHPEGVWQPWLAEASLTEPSAGGTACVREVRQYGQCLWLRMSCDPLPGSAVLTPALTGPLIELPYHLPSEATNVDCLITTAPHSIGKVISGSYNLSGKTNFSVGFVLPDAMAAATAVKLIRRLELDLPHGVDCPLFALRRTLGRDASGKVMVEEIFGTLQLQGQPATNGAHAQVYSNRNEISVEKTPALKTNEPTETTPTSVSTSTLQFRLVDTNGDDPAPTDTKVQSKYKSRSETLYLRQEILMDGRAVDLAGWQSDYDGKLELLLSFTDEGSRQFTALTGSNINHQIAITYQGLVLCAPNIRGTIQSPTLNLPVELSRPDLLRVVQELNQIHLPAVELSWGPEQEQVLPPMTGQWTFLNLRSNRRMTNAQPDSDSREFHDWQREQGADVGAAAEDKFPVLVGYNLATVPAGSNMFNAISQAEIKYHWDLMTREPKPRSILGINPKTGEDTYYFRTQDDTWGVLQIIGFTNNPPGVRVRYKVVEVALAAAGKASKNETKEDNKTLRVKTIMLTRATNQLVGTTGNVRSVDVWTDTTMNSDEKILTLIKTVDGQMRPATTFLATSSEGNRFGTTSCFNWTFSDSFGQLEADTAVSQMVASKTERGLALTSWIPVEMFCVTNRVGGALTGFLKFDQSEPSPASAANVAKATVRVRDSSEYSAWNSLSYEADIPAGYALRATANEGRAETETPGGPWTYTSTWMEPIRPFNPQRSDISTVTDWMIKTVPMHPYPGGTRPPVTGRDTFTVVLGQPMLIFSRTNEPGDVWQGYLELVGPDRNQAQ